MFLIALTGGLLAGCSDAQKKLSDGSPSDVLLYQVLGQERPTSYYYQIVRDSHDSERFCYRCTQDPFLVDKSINAVQKLGDAPFARLEGQAVVVGKLTEVLLEDPSALAQAGAAGSLTKIGVKLPRYPQRGPEETGARFVQLLREMDALHDENGVRRQSPGCVDRLGQIITEIGDFKIRDLVLAKESIRPFHNRAYLVDETDPRLRSAIDTALTKRLDALIRVALEAAVPAASPWVRADAIRGLKILAEPAALPAVAQQLEVDPNWQVRGEAVEYLGRIGSSEAVAALLPLVSDSDPSVSHKAVEALRRIAGEDYGRRRRAWTRWAARTYPDLADLERELEEDTASDDVVPPVQLPGGPGPGPLPPSPLPQGPLPGTPLPQGPLPPSAGATGPDPLAPVPPGPSAAPGPMSRVPPPPPEALPDPVVRTPGRGARTPNGVPATRASAQSPPPPPPPPPGYRAGPAPTRTSQRAVPQRGRSVPPPPPPPAAPQPRR